MEEDNNLGLQYDAPQITEQFSNIEAPQQVSPVDYVYNSIKSKATAPSLLEEMDQTKSDANYFSSIFKAAAPEPKLSFSQDRISVDEAYTKLTDGSYITRYDEGFIKGADNEQIYADRQGTGSKWLNGLGKFVGKTIVNTAGGFLGTAYGAIAAIGEGNWERIYDNSFYDFLDDQNTKMDNFAANYRTQEERDNGFGSSLLTANFWADDFLGGLSFMTGTVLSESLWAVATGGTSLATTAARVGFRGAKYFNTSKKLVKGVKDASKTGKGLLRAEQGTEAAARAITAGKIGEVANLARFTYTGAGYEAGMEARLYQREQRENFYNDFERLNGYKPSASDVADFEDGLGKTTNALWLTNMALVGTSNFAVLGKTFGISSPFKGSSKALDKFLYGKGTKTTLNEAGEKVTEAITRTKLQRGLGFGKAIAKNPFYEGVVEEGGQATASSAMENYLTSRYNPSEDAMGIVESMYDGLAHTYGTKEGWKEVGLGMLIGFFGGEATSFASGNGLFTEAREAGQEQGGKVIGKDSVTEKEIFSGDRGAAQSQNDNRKVLDKVFATDLLEKISTATEIQNLEAQRQQAEDKGDSMSKNMAEKALLLTSVKQANDFDYLEEQYADFEAALKMRTDKEIADRYGIPKNEAGSQREKILEEYKQMGKNYNKAKTFMDYMISDNPKELFDEATEVDVHMARQAGAYQMVMAGVMEENMLGAYEALKDQVSELPTALQGKYMQALTRFNQVNRSNKKVVQELQKIETTTQNLIDKRDAYLRAIAKLDNLAASRDKEANQRQAKPRQKYQQSIDSLNSKIEELNQQKAISEGKMTKERGVMGEISAQTRSLVNQLDAVDPLLGEDVVDEMSLREMQKSLEELDQTLSEVARTNPQLVDRIQKLGNQYQRGLEMWKRNADTMADLADPELGLNRIGTMMQRKKQAGETTLNFLERLKRTGEEEKAFANALRLAMAGETRENNPEEDTSKPETSTVEDFENEEGDSPAETTQEDIDKRIEELEQQRQEELDSVSQQTATTNIEDKKADIERRRQDELEPYNLSLAEVNKMPSGLLRNFLIQANQAINNIKTNGGQALLDYLNSNRSSVYDKTAEDNRFKKKQNTVIASDAIDAGLAPNWKVNDLRQAIKLYNSLLSNKEEINSKYDAELTALENNSRVTDNSSEISRINKKYDKKIADVKNTLSVQSQSESTGNPLQDKLNSLRNRLKELLLSDSYLQNFTDDENLLIEDEKPTQEEVEDYEKLRKKSKGDINKIVGRDIESIGKRTKERSNLTDEEITRYNELNTKFKNWRMVMGSRDQSLSVEDILNQIEAYEKDLKKVDTQITAQQAFEMTAAENSDFDNNPTYTNNVNTMETVNARRGKAETEISHLDIKTIAETEGFQVVQLPDFDRGSESNPKLMDAFQITTPNGTTISILRDKGNNRLFIPSASTDAFLEGMDMQIIKYNTATYWGYAFKSNTPMESDFSIRLANGVEVMAAQEIYKLNPGDRVGYTVNMQDSYLNETIIPLIQEGKIEEAKALLPIYVTDSEGKVLGFLQSARADNTGNASNFDTVRQNAIDTLQARLDANNSITAEDLANDSTTNEIKLPYETTVRKVFVGSPNMELDEKGEPKLFDLTEKNIKTEDNPNGNIVGKGFAVNGKIDEADNVRKTFIPKGVSTPYVIIDHNGSKIAFPVTVKPTDKSIQGQVVDILNSKQREQDKVLQVIELLRSNEIEAAQFNIETVEDISNILGELSGQSLTFSKKELNDMSLEEFAGNSQIIINLEKPAFVSPKVATDLSTNLIDLNTKQTSADKGMTLEEIGELIDQYQVELAKATTKEEVEAVVREIGGELQKAYETDGRVKTALNKLYKANNAIETFHTEEAMEEILTDRIDLDTDEIPLDLREGFQQEMSSIRDTRITRPELIKQIKALAKKVRKAMNKKFVVVSSALNKKGLYYSPTPLSEQEMFDKYRLVRIEGDLYRKVSDKYNKEDLIDGLYNKYKSGTLPSHMVFEEGLSIKEFTDRLPLNEKDIYNQYYDTKPIEALPKKAVVDFKGQEVYLREGFESDFSKFITKHREGKTEVYNKFLQHFTETSKGTLPNNTVTRELVEKYKNDLGELYRPLLDYFIINKHIDLQVSPESVTFTTLQEDQKATIEAINDIDSLERAEDLQYSAIGNGEMLNIPKKLAKSRFISYKGGVYEMKEQDGAEMIYEFIAEPDPKFYTTEYTIPIGKTDLVNDREKDTTKAAAKKTKTASELNKKCKD